MSRVVEPGPTDDPVARTYTGVSRDGSLTIDATQRVTIVQYRSGRIDVVQGGVPVRGFPPEQVASLEVGTRDYLDSRTTKVGGAIGYVMSLVMVALILAFAVLAVRSPGEIIGRMLWLLVAAVLAGIVGVAASLFRVGVSAQAPVLVLRLADGHHLTIYT